MHLDLIHLHLTINIHYKIQYFGMISRDAIFLAKKVFTAKGREQKRARKWRPKTPDPDIDIYDSEKFGSFVRL